MQIRFTWKPDHPELDICFGVVRSIGELAHEQMTDLADVFPFQSVWKGKVHMSDSWVAVYLESKPVSGVGAVPSIGGFEDDELAKLEHKVSRFEVRSHQQLHRLLGSEWLSFNRFTYVGPSRDGHLSWPDLQRHMVDWLNHLVVPEVLRLNAARVLRAIPKPPQFNISVINQALWILECDETFKQGTAFMLEGVGMVTCEHVIGTNTQAFRPDKLWDKYPVKVVSKHEFIDLAVLETVWGMTEPKL